MILNPGPFLSIESTSRKILGRAFAISLPLSLPPPPSPATASIKPHVWPNTSCSCQGSQSTESSILVHFLRAEALSKPLDINLPLVNLYSASLLVLASNSFANWPHHPPASDNHLGIIPCQILHRPPNPSSDGFKESSRQDASRLSVLHPSLPLGQEQSGYFSEIKPLSVSFTSWGGVGGLTQ